MIVKILLAVDGSEPSDAAVAAVGQRPWPTGTELRVITVHPPAAAVFLRGNSSNLFDELVQQQRREALKSLDAAVGQLRRAFPDLLVTQVLREGWPKDVILDEAETWGADLIVVGSQGSGSIRRMFLGSVALAIATHAPCSVAVIRRPPPR